MLVKWFGNGAELSIGQWQRMVLARAFLCDAQIIVRDEPTDSMDAKAAVFENLRELARGRTAIFLSYRFSTIRMLDCIYVLDGRRNRRSGYALKNWPPEMEYTPTCLKSGPSNTCIVYPK